MNLSPVIGSNTNISLAITFVIDSWKELEIHILTSENTAVLLFCSVCLYFLCFVLFLFFVHIEHKMHDGRCYILNKQLSLTVVGSSHYDNVMKSPQNVDPDVNVRMTELSCQN